MPELSTDTLSPRSRLRRPKLGIPEANSGEALLRAEQIAVNFGGVRAVQGVTLEVRPGQLIGLIGPNGAGKTTLIDAMFGFVATSEGDVILNGQSINVLQPHARAAAGLVRTFQSIELFDDLTVRENLLVGAIRPRWWNLFTDMVVPNWRTPQDAVMDAVDMFQLHEYLDLLPSGLSLGTQKLVAVARALASRPSFLLLDEPAAGLDTSESIELGKKIRELADNGVGILLVDHDMGLVLGFCDYVYVMEFGELIADGIPADVRQDPRVIAAYLGSENPETLSEAAKPVQVEPVVIEGQ